MTPRPRVSGNIYKPVLVTVEEGEHAGEYQVHLGKPGRPRIYRSRDDRLTRLDDKDPAIHAVAVAMREGIDKRQALEAAEMKRRSTWHFRLRRRIGTWWAYVVGWFR